MIGQIAALFNRYVSHHGRVDFPQQPLIDTRGEVFGQLEQISLVHGRVLVEGWTLATTVGLTCDGGASETVPNLSREDVYLSLNSISSKRSGFSLSLATNGGHVFLWVEHHGKRYVYPLFNSGRRELWAMRRQQALPFLRDGMRAVPPALMWLRRRDPQLAAQIKRVMRLQTVSPSARLDPQLFKAGPTDAKHMQDSAISIAIPIYNAFDLLPDVLNRVIHHTDLPWRLFLIEDCSSDDRVRPWLRQWHAGLTEVQRAKVVVLENDQNLGFIRSVNRGLAKAIPLGDHVVLLNSDALVPANWASRLLQPLLQGKNVATVTPMSNDAEIFNVPVMVQRTDLVSGQADALDLVAQTFSLDACLAEAPTGVGFCMAMNIEYLRNLPDLDTVFGRGYGEEVDWCQRARQKGGRHIGHGGLFVEHRGGTSFGSEEKLELVRQNNGIISRRYPKYDQEVQDFIRHDPLATPRLALAIALAGIRQQGRVPVYLAHSMGGGAETYLQGRIASDLEDGSAALVVRVGGASRWSVELHNSEGLTRGETNDTEFLQRLLAQLPARNVIYSCGVGDRNPVELPSILRAMARGPEDRIEVLFHDFFPISPSYTLLNSEGVYDGLPQVLGNTDPAHKSRHPDGTEVSLAAWRDAWGDLAEAANKITVFSENTRELVQKAYPQAASRVAVVPHSLPTDVPRLSPQTSIGKVPVIGVLGNIGYQKGADILQSLSEGLAQTGRARLVIIGRIDPAYKLMPPSVVHGPYKVEDIPALVRNYKIDCWLSPSIWPETFSYATHEALATGLPVWSFDLGAQGEAVAKAAAERGQGGVIPLPTTDVEIAGLLDSILDTRRKTHE